MTVTKHFSGVIISCLLLAGQAYAEDPPWRAGSSEAPVLQRSETLVPLPSEDVLQPSEETQRRSDRGQKVELQLSTAIQDVTDKPVPLPPPPPPPPPSSRRLVIQGGDDGARPVRVQGPY